MGLVEAADPQLFGFGLHAGGTFLHKYIVSVPAEPDCVAESDSQGSLTGTLICRINATGVEGVNLFAKEGAAPGDYTVGFASTVPFVFTALVNGTESTPISVYRAFTNLTLKVKSPLPTAPQGLITNIGDSAVVLSWDEPNDGAITEHQYRTSAGDEGWGEWADIPNSGAGAANATSHTVGGLTNGVFHSFQVRGVNATGPGAPSEVVTTTPRDAPEFKGGERATRSVPENTGRGQSVGESVSATDNNPEGFLAYSLGGPDGDFFVLNLATGQLTTLTNLDYEDQDSYTVTLAATYEYGSRGSIEVTVEVEDVAEPPPFPTELWVDLPQNNGHDSLMVSWDQPLTIRGVPPITSYEVGYRKRGGRSWTVVEFAGRRDNATLGDLAADTTYEVKVRAWNHEGTSGWTYTLHRKTALPQDLRIYMERVDGGRICDWCETTRPMPSEVPTRENTQDLVEVHLYNAGEIRVTLESVTRTFIEGPGMADSDDFSNLSENSFPWFRLPIRAELDLEPYEDGVLPTFEASPNDNNGTWF